MTSDACGVGSRNRRLFRNPAPKKLGIKPGQRGCCSSTRPTGFALDLPEGVTARASGEADVILAFHAAPRRLAEAIPALREQMDKAAGLWIAWPKRAAKLDTDLTEDVVRELALANTLVDNKVCAIDETWSGLRLVIRLRDRC